MGDPEGPAGDPLPDAAAMERLADELLPALIAHFNASGLGELEIRRGDWRVRLRASAAGRSTPAGEGSEPGTSAGPGRKASRPAGGPASAPMPGSASANGAAPSEGGERHESSGARAAAERRIAASPGVGYFSARDGLAAGSAVRAGDVLGHVDVLGVAVEVVAPADGLVAHLLAGGGEAVEYGQELVRLEPSPSGAAVRES